MTAELSEEAKCTCDCECECCRQGKYKLQKALTENNPISQVHVYDTVGAVFLGVLALLLLVFLVRSNKRNRELLLEVIQLRRQA